MTREEAVKEIEKAFEPAFANYIITALAEGATVSDKEPFKPMIEIDLYSVIKQSYIEREVLDKIRAEIEEYKLTIDNAISEDELKIEGMKEAYTDCLEIIDKYRAESEET